MKVLVVDDKDILHKGEYKVEAVVILFDWGYSVVSKEQGVQEYCTDLEKLLSNPDCPELHLKAVRLWLEKVLQQRGMSNDNSMP